MDEIHDRADAGSPANGVAVPDRADGDTGEHTKAHVKSPHLRPPWPKGVSGNPGGRPKGTSIVARILDLVAQDTGGGKTISDRIAAKFVAEALKGKYPFARDVLERVDGKVSERVEHAGFGGGPIVFDVTVREQAAIESDAWRRQKMAEISERPSKPPTAP